MSRTAFNTDWSYRPKTSIFADVQGQSEAGQPVRLPHDAIISLDRKADAPSGAAGAFFPDGAFEYNATLRFLRSGATGTSPWSLAECIGTR